MNHRLIVIPRNPSGGIINERPLDYSSVIGIVVQNIKGVRFDIRQVLPCPINIARRNCPDQASEGA